MKACAKTTGDDYRQRYLPHQQPAENWAAFSTPTTELQADRLLIDERLGRQVAQRFGLKVTGLLGVLVAAKQDNLIIELKPILDELIFKAKFRVHPDLYHQILQDANESG